MFTKLSYSGKFSQVQKFLKNAVNFIFAVFISASAQIIIDHANSKIHRFKISQFLLSQNQHGRGKRENLHHAKIFRYAVSFFTEPVFHPEVFARGGITVCSKF